MEAEIWQALGLTFQLAIITTLLLLLGGLPLAHFLNSLPNRFGAVLETIVGLCWSFSRRKISSVRSGNACSDSSWHFRFPD